MRIGFLSIWFERGQTIVTKTLRDCLSAEHETFIFARMGVVYGKAKQDQEDINNITYYPTYQVKQEDFSAWIIKNKLDVVVFNEEYDWGLVLAARNCKVKTITYLDFYTDKWKNYMYLFDLVLCSTHRTYNMVKDICNTKFIGWGVDTDLFKPQDSGEKFTFFHNAGWLGINYRKMTPLAIAAFDELSKVDDSVSLLVHAQAERDLLPKEINEIIDLNPKIKYLVKTIPAPGLYHQGEILLFTSKLEGLGLPLPEGLSCGLPAIVCNAAPMNEFVKDGYNGVCIPVYRFEDRNDGVAFPEAIMNPDKLIEAMAKHREIVELSYNARQSILDNFSLVGLRKRLLDIFREYV